VQKSLMPKGVDHSFSVGDFLPARPVQKSLMPKGVDHASNTALPRLHVACKNL